ncbi:hypothetical protein C0991_000430 [Blastosporella zonata]|nr:hypothetical protein C0991_000430 [Blastosporella zonata]
MVNTVAASVKSSTWEGSDGIITEGASTTSNNDGVGFKGLSETFTRNPSNTDLRTLIHSYVDVQVSCGRNLVACKIDQMVQYNALLDLPA